MLTRWAIAVFQLFVQACLELSRQQEDALLEAHARLRRQFEIAHSELARLLSALKSHEHSNRKADSHSPSGAPAPEAPAHASCNSPGSSDSQASGATQCGGFQVSSIMQDLQRRSPSELSLGGTYVTSITITLPLQVEGIDWGPAGPILRALRRFLEGERWAVYSFYNTVLDAVCRIFPSFCSPELCQSHERVITSSCRLRSQICMIIEKYS